MRKLLLVIGILGVVATLSAQYQGSRLVWVEQSSGETLLEFDSYDNFYGKLGMLNASGEVKTDGHPFFTPLGTNGRACVNCHQPAWGMSVSAEAMMDRWRFSDGKDPVFAAFDGANCPSLPQDQQSSHSLLLKRGLFRIPIAWPPKNADGSNKPVEFSIEVVSDATGCNTSKEHGLTSATPTVSVYRRPRPTANLRYVVASTGSPTVKSGLPADLDPETGKPVAMNLMSDAREATLTTQALSAIMGHEQATKQPTREQLEKIVAYESQVYVAQAAHHFAGAFNAPGAPQLLGMPALRDGKPGLAATNDDVFGKFDSWKTSRFDQASVARGADIFTHREFMVRDTAHLNTTGNPAKSTCATCHKSQLTGQDVSAGWMDVGTTNYAAKSETPAMAKSELPVFKITCAKDATPHPFLGRTIYTTDPGRALISGKCADVGSIVMQQLRGLAARAPYFANGSAKDLRGVVDFYDSRYEMGLSEFEKEDLVAFLGVL
ncbi:MAG: hypothetical protein ABIR70_18040 [Bryobacteraceae bacterium]